MTTPDTGPDTVTLAEIARMAGIGRAAVANLRRRHADFPPAVGGTEGSPRFDAAAAEAWLTAWRGPAPVGEVTVKPADERGVHEIVHHLAGEPGGSSYCYPGELDDVLADLRRWGWRIQTTDMP